MSALYLSIRAVQPPFEYGQDDKSRVLFSCNYNIQAVNAADRLCDDFRDWIVGAGLGVFGTTLGIGPAWTIPAGSGPITTIINTGGYATLMNHSNIADIDRLTAQTIVRGADYQLTHSRAVAIWRLLQGITNVTLP